jgi:hypothetical protein
MMVTRHDTDTKETIMELVTDRVRCSEEHTATASVPLTAAEDGSDDISFTERRWSSPKRGYVETTKAWRPDRLGLTWRWDRENGEWLLVTAYVAGHVLKADGTVGRRGMSDGFIEGRYTGTPRLALNAPDYVRQAIETFRPTSYVGGE